MKKRFIKIFTTFFVVAFCMTGFPQKSYAWNWCEVYGIQNGPFWAMQSAIMGNPLSPMPWEMDVGLTDQFMQKFLIGVSGVTVAIQLFGQRFSGNINRLGENINAARGLASDTERFAKHRKEQAEWVLFAQGLAYSEQALQANAMYKTGLNLGALLQDATNKMKRAEYSDYSYGRKVQDDLNSSMQVLEEKKFELLPIGKVFTQEETRFFIGLSSLLSDPFASLVRPTNKNQETQRGKDAEGIRFLREIQLEMRRQGFLSWLGWYAPVAEFKDWLLFVNKYLSVSFADRGLNADPSKVSMALYHAMMREYFLSTAYTEGLVSLNEEGLMRELMKIRILQQSVHLETLNTWKTISLQLVSRKNSDTMKAIELRMWP